MTERVDLYLLARYQARKVFNRCVDGRHHKPIGNETRCMALHMAVQLIAVDPRTACDKCSLLGLATCNVMHECCGTDVWT